MIDRGIAMQDLGKEQVDDRHGVEPTAAPGVIDLAAGICDLGSFELFGGGPPELAKDAYDSVVLHDVLPAEGVSIYHLYEGEYCLCSTHSLHSLYIKWLKAMQFCPLFQSNISPTSDGWQTRRTQNPVRARGCGCKSHLR